MSIFPALLFAALLLLCVAVSASADERASPQTTKLLEDAKRCDDLAAVRYAKMRDETADTVSIASFDSCGEAWVSAAKHFYEDIKPHFDEAYSKQNKWYLHEYFRALSEMPFEKEIVANWRDGEIHRLRVLILDIRLTNP